MGEPTDYKVPPPETVQELAKLARCAFTLETREDGSEYWTHNRCAPEWIGELCNTAHGDMLPDDYRYRFIVQALDALEEAEDVDEAGQDWEYEYRYYRVVEWLSSHPGRRLEYCDDAVRHHGNPASDWPPVRKARSPKPGARVPGGTAPSDGGGLAATVTAPGGLAPPGLSHI